MDLIPLRTCRISEMTLGLQKMKSSVEISGTKSSSASHFNITKCIHFSNSILFYLRNKQTSKVTF